MSSFYVPLEELILTKQRVEGLPKIKLTEIALETGISYLTLQNIKNGAGCNLETLHKLKDYFSCEVQDLLKERQD